MNCSTCQHRIFGLGCQLTGKRVTDHETCKSWEPIDNRSIHENDDRVAYFKMGKILDVEKVSA